jgi:hypothetical protein
MVAVLVKTTLSPNEFKALYKDPMIQSVKLNTRRSGVHVPIVFAEIVDITGDFVVYYYHEGFRQWELVGIDQEYE